MIPPFHEGQCRRLPRLACCKITAGTPSTINDRRLAFFMPGLRFGVVEVQSKHKEGFDPLNAYPAA